MLKIYLCEDNPKQREILSKYINNMILIDDYDIQFVKATDDPHEILELIDSERSTGLYFLDIDLSSDMNGLALAKEIRKIDSRGFIVFITTHSEMSFMTFSYKVEAMDFIIKDDIDKIADRIHQCIINAYSRYSSKNNSFDQNFIIKLSDKEYCLALDEIIYFESSSNAHKVVVHTVSSQLEFAGTLKELASSLDSRFVQCHRAYLINKNHIREINSKTSTIEMSNQDICLTSSKSLKSLI